MGQVIPRQHPAVVLKSHYEALRALLAVALVAIAVLAATVVIVANDDATAIRGVASKRQHDLPGRRFGLAAHDGQVLFENASG